MPNLPTFRDAVQLRIINMSPRKAYIAESADLQLELSRNSWEKSPYGRKNEISSEERVLIAPVLISTQEVFGGQHSLLPSTVLNLEIPHGSLGCFQTTEFTFTNDFCPLECRNL